MWDAELQRRGYGLADEFCEEGFRWSNIEQMGEESVRVDRRIFQQRELKNGNLETVWTPPLATIPNGSIWQVECTVVHDGPKSSAVSLMRVLDSSARVFGDSTGVQWCDI